MVRNNPFIPIIASVAGIFLVICLAVYFWLAFLSTHVKMKDFDTIMGVGVGVNLALGVLSNIRLSICSHYMLRFKGVKSNISDKIKQLIANKTINEDKAKAIENQFDSLQFSIENNKAHDSVQKTTVWFAIGSAVMYAIGLTITAFNPELKVVGWAGLPLALFTLMPIGFFVLFISSLAAYPEYKSLKYSATIVGFSALVDVEKTPFVPIRPTPKP